MTRPFEDIVKNDQNYTIRYGVEDWDYELNRDILFVEIQDTDHWWTWGWYSCDDFLKDVIESKKNDLMTFIREDKRNDWYFHLNFETRKDDGGDYACIMVKISRPMTEEEIENVKNRRLSKDLESKRIEKEHRRRKYEELKKEFEGE